MEFPEEVRARFPTLRWSVVELRRGLPWFARPTTRAMVVPRWFAGVSVRVRADVDVTSAAGRRLLAHEAYHALQYQAGRARFVAAYVLLALRHGFGEAHPLEGPAYAAARTDDIIMRAELPSWREVARELSRARRPARVSPAGARAP